MNELSLTTASLSALVLPAPAQAAPAVKAQGKLNFAVEINAPASGLTP